MGWTNYSYARKGGIIGLIFGGINLLSYFLVPFGSRNPFFYLPNSILYKLNYLYIVDSYAGIYLMILLFTLLFYFLIGALIGWLYGKLKNRKREGMENK